MKLKASILFIFCLGFLCSQANETITPVFWKIGDKKPVYLLGTMHVGVDAGKTFPGEIWEALSTCNTLVLEVDMTKVNQFSLLAKMQLPMDKSLDTLLGEDYWKKLGKLIEPYPLSMIKRFKPWAVQAIVSEKFLPPAPAVELSLTQKANKQKIKIEQLETAEDQMDAIDSIPEEVMIEGIKKMLDDIPTAKKQANEMLEAYKSGDLQKIEEITLLSDEAKEHPEFIENIIYNRNNNWIPHIKNYIEQGNVFIAVGAGHFVGEEGVIFLLEKEGIEVTRIIFNE